MSAETSRHPSLDELSAWVDGEIADTFERQVLAEHVAACATCASLVEDFRALAAAEIAAPVPPVPFHLQGRVLDRIAANRSGRRPVRRLALPLSAAATLLIGVIAVWLYRQQPATAPLATSAPPATDALGTPPAAPPPQIQEAVPPAPAPAPSLPPPEPQRAKKESRQAKDEAAGTPSFAPVPPQEPGAANTTRPEVRWVRLPVSAYRAEAQAVAKTAPERDAAPAPSPASPLEASASCMVRDLLRPPLRWPGMDAESARAVGDRARAAGATEVVLATAPVLRLTLVVPVAAWPAVQDALQASGIPIPEAVRGSPEGGGCLEVPVDAAP